MSSKIAVDTAETSIHVISYNVLSPELSDPKTFPENTADECSGENRLPRILDLLLFHVQRGAVVALQEVSISWLGRLQTFFDQHNYHYSSTLYGGKYSGYMGVGLAFPRGVYALADFEISRIADTKEWPRKPTIKAQLSSANASASSSNMASSLVAYSTSYLRNVFDPLFLLTNFIWKSGSSTVDSSGKKEPAAQNQVEQTFHESRRRWNQAILLRLRRKSDNAVFCVATYHNPCAIHCRPIITLHACLVAEKAQEFAGTDALVLLGDFNMTPDSGGYQLLTTGTLPKSHPEYPTLPKWDFWRPTLKAMRSVYAEAHPEGLEPETTNKAVRLIGKWGAEPNAFSGTLDYIFIMNGETTLLSVEEALLLPDKALLDERPSWPTSKIPSDHLVVGATLKVKAE